MGALVQRQLACLSEGSVAAREVAGEWFLLSVSVGVLLQILGQGEGLEAQNAHVLLH